MKMKIKNEIAKIITRARTERKKRREKGKKKERKKELHWCQTVSASGVSEYCMKVRPAFEMKLG